MEVIYLDSLELDDEIPVTNAFCSCPLNPVTQGLTTTTLLLRNNIKPIAATAISDAPPTLPAKTITILCLDVVGL